jgi:hypothetical protein
MMLVESQSGDGKSVLSGDLCLQALSAETYTAVVDYLQSDINVFILFDSVEAAQEVAYTLRCAWDGCNRIEISDFDSQAFRAAVKLANAQWYEVGDSELTSENRRSLDPQMHSPKLPLGFRNISFIDVRTETNNRLALPDFRKITFPVSRAEVYWAISDWNGRTMQKT